MSNFPITTEGHQKMVKELDDLKNVQRPQIVEAIAVARDHGDLKENAEYHSAREKQSFVEGKILDLEDKLSRAQIIDVKSIKEESKILFGATVTVVDLETDQEIIYKIISDYEADINNNLISIGSPIARGLIGKDLGDVVEIFTPQGKKEYEITNVQYL
jgi:transcription elongation factor GreA